MKYLVMAAMLMAGAATYAQEPVMPQNMKTPAERVTPVQKAEKLSAQLGLNASQQVKVKALFEEQEKSMKATREKFKAQKDEASRNEMVQAMKENREKFNQGMKATLTEAQYAQWKEQSGKRASGFPRNRDKTLQSSPDIKKD
jgi:hypothetical protein